MYFYQKTDSIETLSMGLIKGILSNIIKVTKIAKVKLEPN